MDVGLALRPIICVLIIFAMIAGIIDQLTKLNVITGILPLLPAGHAQSALHMIK